MISDFEYFAPKSVKEAVGLLDKYGDECKVIAGGQSLLILMRQGLVSPPYLIDIKGLNELNYIKTDSDKGVRIGALTTHRTIEKSKALKGNLGVLVEMEHKLASIQTRNWGTIGGNICHGDPAGDPAPVLITLGASLTLTGPKGKRTLSIDEFYKDYFETVMEHDELLTEISIPAQAPNTGTAYTKFNIIESDLATVGVGVSITLASKTGNCTEARIALGAAAPTARRALKAEEVLKGNKITDALLKEAGEVAAGEAEPISDIQASEEYRRELVNVLVARVGKEAFDMAKGA